MCYNVEHVGYDISTLSTGSNLYFCVCTHLNDHFTKMGGLEYRFGLFLIFVY
jgi:hypothetical protein